MDSRVMRPRICRQCGVTFNGGARAWYCPNCRAKRQKEAHDKFRQKGRIADRPLGSTDNCTVCGKPYVVNSARQKYCKDCAYEAVREADRPMSREWNQKHKDTYYPDKNAKRRAPDKVCVVCGKTYSPNGTNTKCCSVECRKELKRQTWRANYHQRKNKK